MDHVHDDKKLGYFVHDLQVLPVKSYVRDNGILENPAIYWMTPVWVAYQDNVLWAKWTTHAFLAYESSALDKNHVLAIIS